MKSSIVDVRTHCIFFGRRAVKPNAVQELQHLDISNSRKIVDTRNRIIHGYDSVSDEIIWGIVIKHLPLLQKEVQSLIGD